MVEAENNGRTVFESSLRALEAEFANAGSHLTIDSAARQAYTRQIKAMADEVRALANRGEISWSQAASQAQEARNTIMDIVRNRSTPVGRAIAERLKLQGKTLNELIAREAMKKFGAGVNFSRLPSSQQNIVYAEIVQSAGRSNSTVTATMRKLSRAGKGLIVLSVGLAIYTVMTAENKAQAAVRELAVTGVGIGGGIAGGALAGLSCGPGAPVCVAVGAFVGGAMAAFGVDFFW